jgi:hypothetical protein
MRAARKTVSGEQPICYNAPDSQAFTQDSDMPTLPEAIDRVREYPAKHLRVLGLPGSRLPLVLKERYQSLSHDTTSGDVFIVTYSKEQLARITEAILDDGGGRTGLPPVFTYFTMAREIISASTGKPPRVIQDIEENLLVQRLVSDHERVLKSDYRKIRDSERLHRELLEVFRLFLQNGIRGESLDRLEAVVRDDRVADIVGLYRRYREALADKGYVTYYDMARVAAEACAELPESHALKRAGALLVDDFQDVDAGQFELLTALAPPGGDTALNVFGDPMGAYFRARGTHHRYLMDVFPSMYSCETVCVAGKSLNDRLLGDTLGALAREVLANGAEPFIPVSPATSGLGPLFDGVGDTDGGAVDLRVASDEVEEIYNAAACVHDMMANDGFSPNEIAIVANDKADYEIMVRAAFAQRGVAVDTGRARQDVFRSFVHSILTLMQSPKDSVALQETVTSPFYEYFRSGIEELRASRVSDPAREAKHLTRATTAAGLPADPNETMTHLITKWLRPACERYERETGDDSVFAFLSLLKKRWDEYAAAAGATGYPPNLRAFVSRSDLFRTTAASPMPSADEVGLYSCREVKGRSFRAVIVLGCSELLFPKPMRREMVIPSTALQEFLDTALPELRVRVYEAQSPVEHLHDEYHLLYHSLTRARERLYITAPRQFAGRTLPAPAAILDENLPESVRAGISGDDITPPQIRFARAWVRHKPAPAVADRLSGLSPFGRLWNLGPPSAEEFAIDRFPLSKSSLERYLKCPRLFFYEKVLRIPQEDTNALLVGNIFHGVMARIGERFPRKGALHEKITGVFIRDTIEQVIESERKKGERIDTESFFGVSLRFHLNSMVRAALGIDKRESDDYTVTHVEEPFRLDHGGWEFRGRFDRIERTTLGGSVLDYKTGEFVKKGETLRKRTLDALEKPERANWQVPIYVRAYDRTMGEMPDTFRHLVQSPGQDPFFVTVYIRRSENEVPAVATSRRRVDQGFSYLLEGELEGIMDRAAAYAAEVFSKRRRFEKTEDFEQCRRCPFGPTCDRRRD